MHKRTVFLFVMLSLVLLIVAACGATSEIQDKLKAPDVKQVLAQIKQASNLAFTFQVSPLLYDNKKCILLQAPNQVTTFESLNKGETIPSIFCEALESETQTSLSYDDWLSKVNDLYAPDMAKQITARVATLPNNSDDTPLYVQHAGKLLVNAGVGGRGSTLGLVNDWKNATLTTSDDEQTAEKWTYKFVLPYNYEALDGEQLTEDQQPGELDRTIELLWSDGKWKLNTEIDTLGM